MCVLKKKSLMIGIFLFYLMVGVERAKHGKDFLSVIDVSVVIH